ncbi:MAG: putative C-S lyase [Desulfofustis sp.]|nr:putative C-S lyase [Desulfofustis sp.]
MFDRKIDRIGSGSAKWDGAPVIFGEADILPMWVADMDFAVAEPITEAILGRGAHPIYGYESESDSVKQAVVDRLDQKFNWRVEKQWLVFSAGVVHALHMIILAFTKPGDGVILQPPVYYPFFSAITHNGCMVIENQLILGDGGYSMDFTGLENNFRPTCSGLRPEPSRARMLLLCSPHNPVGRVWREEELAEAARIVTDNHGLIISDEIHAELLLGGNRHIPTATLGEEVAQNTITCFAPSKTFNLAGLKASVLIIPNPKLRNVFRERTAGFLSTPCAFGMAAMEAAFRHGDPWLRDLISYLEGNLQFLREFISARIPAIRVMPIEGTYLVWLDCRDLGLDDRQLRTFMRKKAKVGLDDGYIFGSGGSGFQRINIACPRSTLEEGLCRIEAALAGEQGGPAGIEGGDL